jgi:hypothetical protein
MEPAARSPLVTQLRAVQLLTPIQAATALVGLYPWAPDKLVSSIWLQQCELITNDQIAPPVYSVICYGLP